MELSKLNLYTVTFSSSTLTIVVEDIVARHDDHAVSLAIEQKFGEVRGAPRRFLRSLATVVEKQSSPKESEQTNRVRDPKASDLLVFKLGEVVGYLEDRKEADQACDQLEALHGGRADWSVSVGRYIIRHLSQKKIDAVSILNELSESSDLELVKKIEAIQAVFIPV